MVLIGIGKCSKYYMHIFVIIFCQFICDFFTMFNKDNDEETHYEEEKGDNFIDYSFKLKDHFLIQDLLRFIGSILCGLILYYFYMKNEKNKKEKKQKYGKIEIKTYEEKEKPKKIIFLVCIIYSSGLILRNFLISLKFDAGYWTLEILFLVYLSKRILKINVGNHQKVTMFMLAVILFICQIISFSIPRSKHDCSGDKDCEEKYIYDNNLYVIIKKKLGHEIYIPLIIIVYLISFMMRDYSWVETKYLIDIKGIPIYKILLYTGISGLILVIILLFFTSPFPCKTFHNVNINNFTYFENELEKYINVDKQICNLMDYDEKTRDLKFYYDSFPVFLRRYNKFNGKGIIEIISLPIYVLMNLIISLGQILMLKNIDSIILLVNINFNYFLGRLISFLINDASEKYFTYSLFILLEFEELFAIFAYFIYMEIIELKFCKLDYDLKKNIRSRSMIDYEYAINLGHFEGENDQEINKKDIRISLENISNNDVNN